MLYRLLIFLVLNFAALSIGGYFTGEAVLGDWYLGLNKAPWTPPGWAFGAAWTTIMICFSIYLAKGWPKVEQSKSFYLLYIVQWILNVAWNPIFFYFHNVTLGLITIVALTMLVAYFLYKYWNTFGRSSLLLLPYLIWLMIATSLNAYILLNN